MSTDNPVAIVLVDDHKVLRDGLRALLESEADLTVIADVGTGRDGIEAVRIHQPDVVVLDLGLPDMSGLDVIQAIRRENDRVRIIVLSMHSRPEFVVPAVEAGCDGYIPKSSTHTSLLHAIRIVLTGERYLHPKAATALMRRMTEEQPTEREQFTTLSDREQEVLQLTAMGFSSREIGERLVISPKTAETHRQRAMRKLNLEHRPDLVRFAVRAGILDSYKK